jgi:hypothetical protein
MNNCPKKLNTPPITVKVENLPKFLITIPKPVDAALQKFSPVKAIFDKQEIPEYMHVY